MAMCIYAGCTSVQKPFSSLAFFTLPTDSRRTEWIKNCGNSQLANLPSHARRVVCEKHFSPNSLRKQFHRTILRRNAVPKLSTSTLSYISTSSNTCSETEDTVLVVDDQCYENGEMLTDWQSGSENSLTNGKECHVHEITDHSENSVQYEIEPDAAIDDEVIEYVNDENKQSDEEDQQLETTNTNDKLQVEFLSTYYEDVEKMENEVEVETVATEKRRLSSSTESGSKPAKIPNINLEEESVMTTPENSNYRQDDPSFEVIVTSSSVQSDQTQTSSVTSNKEMNFEEKYFALSLVGILQRLPPQKRAFAKLNIMKYLTELEYGLETSLN